MATGLRDEQIAWLGRRRLSVSSFPEDLICWNCILYLLVASSRRFRTTRFSSPSASAVPARPCTVSATTTVTSFKVSWTYGSGDWTCSALTICFLVKASSKSSICWLEGSVSITSSSCVDWLDLLARGCLLHLLHRLRICYSSLPR